MFHLMCVHVLSLMVFKLSLYVFDAPESPFGFSLLF